VATPPRCTFVGGLTLTLLTLGHTARPPGPAAANDRADRLPGSFGWPSTGPLISAEPEADHPIDHLIDHPIVPVKDSAVLRHTYRGPVCLTTATTAGAWSPGGSGACPIPVEARAAGRRHLRVRATDSLSGTWTPPADARTNALTRSNNVTFDDDLPARTKNFPHGGMIRHGVDETTPIDPCRLRSPYQGPDPAAIAAAPNSPGGSRC
jgi:hypothetical protein